uniref:Predicted protein n=1 Tax=Hordeum vulgare subsp. vulgare TaxID=112509 RepID=F2CVB5_HORVV|nr:predicted protein [Hordeum vulgare subsp. vulgare]
MPSPAQRRKLHGRLGPRRAVAFGQIPRVCVDGGFQREFCLLFALIWFHKTFCLLDDLIFRV